MASRLPNVTNVLVKHLMTKTIYSVSMDSTLDMALKCLNTHSIHRIPVIDDDGNLKGIITDRDLRLACDSPFLPESNEERVMKLSQHKVSQVMKNNPLTIEENSPVVDVAKLLRVSDVGGLPVVDNNGKYKITMKIFLTIILLFLIFNLSLTAQGESAIECPQLQMPECKGDQELVSKKGADGCTYSECVPLVKHRPCPQYRISKCPEGQRVQTTMDRGCSIDKCVKI
ncbi:putative acetoin dehydrogenase [Heterostelium album PN500]|uniref:Putative acetoin dehydrogenase n=1 Tax=Heterostelium pallidum (strain ATCC 26659 / Pp 5 / PN500) TaxID=670386 RepID=D3B7F1_HETP5|nr:putative acetoin dehydrogenase [Heterostelium album PN500]EFA82694.1 putative acetoin dehydrogenase [Heterostelium album PN500]|eukprot:XP_020434811.1 putative acetoin dehydrogenase [Heterostelium album PN500]